MSGMLDRRWVRIGLLGAVLVLLLTAGVTWWRARPVTVEVVAVAAQPLVRSLQFSARVATWSRVDVGSTLTGRVVQVLVDEGASVRKGAVLLRLDADELGAALTQAQASERQAQARLDGLRTTGRQSARSAVAQAEANLQAAQAELQRAQELLQKGFVSASRVDEARRAVDVARSQQAAAQAQFLANDDSGTDARQAVAQLELARAATLAARARLAQAVVTAPADARVLTRAVEPGQIVQPGRALLNLALSGPALLTAQVDERFLEQLQVGQAASVVADAFAGQRFAARVQSLAPAVDPQRGTVEVKLALVPPVPAFLREDMTLSVEVETARRERSVVLPLAALRSPASGSGTSGASATPATVWVVTQDQVAERSVQLGLRTLDAVEVVQGLQAGDLVVLGGNARPGHAVRSQAVAWKPGRTSSSGAAGGDAAAALSNAMGR